MDRVGEAERAIAEGDVESAQRILEVHLARRPEDAYARDLLATLREPALVAAPEPAPAPAPAVPAAPKRYPIGVALVGGVYALLAVGLIAGSIASFASTRAPGEFIATAVGALCAWVAIGLWRLQNGAYVAATFLALIGCGVELYRLVVDFGLASIGALAIGILTLAYLLRVGDRFGRRRSEPAEEVAAQHG